MNSVQAKAIPLAGFLAQLGHTPAYERSGDLWYKSPLRPDERTPSFKLDPVRGIWYDFGLGRGGTIVDLMMALHASTDIAQALARIEAVVGVPSARVGALMGLPVRRGASLGQSGGVDRLGGVEWADRVPGADAVRQAAALKRVPEIDRVGVIEDAALLRYLVARSIPPELARLHLSEIHYRLGEDRYRALAFANDVGGYEVRNPYFKGSLGKKAMTYLPKAGRTEVAVFEGSFDYLSALAWHGLDRAEGNVLVLNSLSLLDRGMARLRAETLAAGIERVEVYFDHDKAGRFALAQLRRLGRETGQETEQGSGEVDGVGGVANQGLDVLDRSGLYLGHKDFNAFLMAEREQERQRERAEVQAQANRVDDGRNERGL